MIVEPSNDTSALASLHVEAFEDAWSAEALRALLDSPGVFALAVEDARRPIGFILVRVAAEEAEILTLATSPEHRRRGVARALVRGVAELAAMGGAKALFLEVAEDNAAALALYASEQFAEVGRRAGYYARGAGRLDARVLRRDLNSGAAEPYGARGLKRSDRVDRLEHLCIERGLRTTEQRRVIARVLSSASDHPDVEELHRRAHQIDPHISIATVYRTVRLFEESGILTRHDFRQNRSRYEEASETHHDHLIDMKTGAVIEFVDEDIEALQKAIARRLGYRLVDHRLELYAVPADD
jgi:Fur family ferric uptake transcriptional regulator